MQERQYVAQLCCSVTAVWNLFHPKFVQSDLQGGDEEVFISLYVTADSFLLNLQSKFCIFLKVFFLTLVIS